MSDREMLIARGLTGNIHRDDELHRVYYDHETAGTLERVVVDATTRRRSRFRTTTESGTDLGVVVQSDDGLRPGDVLAVDDSDHLFVVEFEQERAVVVDLSGVVGASDASAATAAGDAGETEILAAAVAFGHVVGNKHWNLAVDGGRVYVKVGADGHRVADELREQLLDGAALSEEWVDPTLFDGVTDHTHGGTGDHEHGHTHGSHGHHGQDEHSHEPGSHDQPLTRPTRGNDE